MAEDRNSYVDYTQGSSGGTTGDLSNYYTKAQTVGLVNTTVTNSQKRDELLLGYKAAHATGCVEPTRVGDKITEIGIWTDSGKGTKLYTKTFTYSGDFLVGVAILDEVNGQALVKGLTYLDGKWIRTQINYEV